MAARKAAPPTMNTSLTRFRGVVVDAAPYFSLRTTFPNQTEWLLPTTSDSSFLCKLEPILHFPNGSTKTHYETFYTGIAPTVLDAIARAANVTHYDLYTAAAGGARQPDGSWTGQLGMLQRNEADVAIARLGMTDDRVQDFTFTLPNAVGVDSIIIHNAAIDDNHKEKFNIDFFSVVRPFHFTTWAALIVSMVVCTSIMTSLDFFSLKVRRQRSPLTNAMNFVENLENVFFYVWSKNGRPDRLLHGPTTINVVLLAWALFCTIFMSIYPAELSARLTVARPRPPPFSNFVTLRAAGYKLIGTTGGYFENTLPALRADMRGTADGEALDELIADRKIWPKSNTELFDMIRARGSKFATINSDPPTRVLNNGTACDMLNVPIMYETRTGRVSPLQSQTTGFAMRNQNDNDTKALRTVVNREMLTLKQWGIMEALTRRGSLMLKIQSGAKNFFLNCALTTEQKQHLEQQQQKASSTSSLQFRQLASTFVLLGGGILLATLCNVVEYVERRVFSN